MEGRRRLGLRWPLAYTERYGTRPSGFIREPGEVLCDSWRRKRLPPEEIDESIRWQPCPRCLWRAETLRDWTPPEPPTIYIPAPDDEGIVTFYRRHNRDVGTTIYTGPAKAVINRARRHLRGELSRRATNRLPPCITEINRVPGGALIVGIYQSNYCGD